MNNFFDKLQELDESFLKKFGRLTPQKYRERLHNEIDEFLNACVSDDPTDLVFELFDVIAFTYAYMMNVKGMPHKLFEELLASKALLVKERLERLK